VLFNRDIAVGNGGIGADAFMSGLLCKGSGLSIGLFRRHRNDEHLRAVGPDT